MAVPSLNVANATSELNISLNHVTATVAGTRRFWRVVDTLEDHPISHTLYEESVIPFDMRRTTKDCGNSVKNVPYQ